jgi:hypothetical protein
MLAKRVESCPTARAIFEPKWDGFRVLVFRDGDELCSRAATRSRSIATFPSCRAALGAAPARCVLDGEIVDRARRGPRLRGAPAAHPPRRVARRSCLAKRSRRRRVLGLLCGATRPARPPFATRRARSSAAREREAAAAPDAASPRSRVRADWFARFEGAGLDGVMAKPERHLRAEQARHAQGQARARVRLRGGGFRWHKAQRDARRLAAARPLRRRRRAAPRRRLRELQRAKRRELVRSSRPTARTRSTSIRGRAGRRIHAAEGQRMPGAKSRWSSGKDLSWSRSARAGRRGRLRPHAGHALPPKPRTSARAPTQGPRARHYRSSKSCGARARGDFADR